MLSRSTRGRAPSVPLLPPSQIDGGASFPAWSPGGSGAGEEGEGRARKREALEFLSRRRHRTTRDFRENSKTRIRQKSRKNRLPRPSAATLFKTCTLYFWVYPDPFLKLTTPAPAIPSQSHPTKTTPLSLFVPQSKRGVVFMGFLAYMGGGG